VLPSLFPDTDEGNCQHNGNQTTPYYTSQYNQNGYYQVIERGSANNSIVFVVEVDIRKEPKCTSKHYKYPKGEAIPGLENKWSSMQEGSHVLLSHSNQHPSIAL
jgi:hypothetical protein